jgi:hypothetical protein
VSSTSITARSPSEFEAELRSYYYESGEEARAVRVGEKEVSEQAAIVGRYTHLFTEEQLGALGSAEAAETAAVERERIHRLRKACESSVVFSKLAPLQDALQNAELSARVEFRGESLPLRSAKARVSTLASYADRDELGTSAWDVSAELNPQRVELLRGAEELYAELSGEPDPIARSEVEKGVSLRRLADVAAEAGAATATRYEGLREVWLDRLLGPDREEHPASFHAAYVHRLSALADVYSKEEATDRCVETLDGIGLVLSAYPNITTDLEDRPQKTARPCVIASDPPDVVHLITRPQGGLQDYQGFLHEAGHAFHYASCDPELPYAFRALARDNALSEVYAFLCESVIREPGWHARFFALGDQQAAENAEVARFLHALLVRRYGARLLFELEFWSRFAREGAVSDGYAERHLEATGFRYRPDSYLSDMDAGFYSADYLRGWIRAAQLRSHLRDIGGEEWWRTPTTGEVLRELFREGTRPTNEELAERIGFASDDVRPLIAELSA